MIYLFDKDEKLIKIVRKSAVKTALQKYALTTERYVSDRLTVELKGLNADELEQVEYMAIQTMEDAHIFHYFYVAQKSSDELTALIGVQSGIEELRKSPIYDKRPQNAFARDVITDLLAGTNWQARFVGETTAHSTNFYYTSVFDALKKVCEVWDLEMQFFVEMNGNRIGARYIDFKQRIGEAVGKRVVYGHNALQILQEVERTNIFTALIGRGKGEETGDGYGRKITFENVVWSTTQGNPVNKPTGQKYLELPLMTREYGIKNADGSMRPKIGFVDFSEEANPEVLIERTYKALIDAARPQLTLKTSSVYLKGVKVGDTIRVVRHDKKLDYDTRIFEITFNRLNNQSSDIKLGDRIGESNEAKAQKIADKAVEQFVNNEFSNFVQNLPDYLPSADGFNNNWYGAEDPTVQYPGKVLINDIWYKPDPEHEGHKIMLRWSGESWEEILRTYDSEALRDRIAEEIARVSQSMQAQSEEHDRQVADILAKTQSVESLANQAKSDAASAITRANQVKTDLQNKVDEADAKAVQAQADANALRTDLNQQAQTILAQAQAQTELTNRVTTVETLADGTKTTVAELSKTVDKANGDITSVTNRTKVVEDGLAGVKTNYTQLNQTVNTQTGQIETINSKTADLQSGIDGVTERFNNLQVGGENLVDKTGEPFVMGYGITNTTWNPNTKRTRLTFGTGIERAKSAEILPQGGVFETQNIVIKRNQTYTQAIRVATDATFLGQGNLSYSWFGPEVANSSVNYHRNRKAEIRKIADNEYLVWCTTTWNSSDIKLRPFDLFDLHTALDFRNTGTYIEFYKPKLETGNLPTDWCESNSDFNNQIAEYKRTADQNYAGLQSTVSTLDGKVSTAETKINQLASEVSSKVSQTDYNALTGRVSSAETAITQNATEISKRLTSTQVEQAITSKGYATVTVLENKVKETADSFNRTISETKALIPSDATNNNLWVQSRTTGTFTTETLPSGHVTGQNFCYKIFNNGDIKFNIEPDFSSRLYRTVTFSAWIKYENVVQGPNIWNVFNCFKHNLIRKNSSTGTTSSTEYLTFGDFTGTSDWKYVSYTYDYSANTSYDQLKTPILFNLEWATTGVAWITGVKIELGSKATGYSLAVEDTATVTALHAVNDTVDSHTRTIGAVGTTGSILDNVSNVTQTANGLVTEVSGANGLKTQVSQLAGSYAIQNLTKAGDVLGQINLNPDGSVRINEGLISVGTKTYIQDGVITSAKIASLDAGKITTGTLDAARIATNSITGIHIAFDQAFVNKMTANEAYLKQIFAKNAFITSVQSTTMSASQISGGVIKALNNAMEINMNDGQVLYYTDNAALKRILSGYPNQFIKFATGTVTGKGNAGVTVIGSNRNGTESSNDGGFVGIRAWNGSNIDSIDVVGDSVRLASSAYDSADGWNVVTLPNKLEIGAYNSNDRASSRVKIGDVLLWKNSTTYSSMRDTINLIIDNLQLLHNNKTTEKGYSYTMPPKV